MEKRPILIFSLLAGAMVFTSCTNTASENPADMPESPEVTQSEDNSKLTAGTPATRPAQPKETAPAAPTSDIFEPAEPDGMEYADKFSAAVFHTNYGKIKVNFYADESPVTVNNFLKLASEGYYDNTKFHRIIKDFMIQGGDPNTKDDNWSDDGIGGPGYTIKDEFNQHKLVKGSLAMANTGRPNTGGSQFFIVTAASTPWLDGKHTNFGQVVEGLDIVEKIGVVETGQNDHPVEDVIIDKIELVAKQ